MVHIVTNRLVLREFTEDDWAAVLAYQNDQRYLRFYPWNHRSGADVRSLVQTFLGQQREEPRGRFQLIMALKETEELIGNCGMRRKPYNHWEGDIGYELAPEFWGNGYATEAALAMVEFGFRELKLHRVSSWCIANNRASARVLEKAGLRLEGRLRENECFKGRWWDTLLYGVLENDWRS